MKARIIESNTKKLSQLFKRLTKDSISFSMIVQFKESVKTYIESNVDDFRNILNDPLFKEYFDVLDNTPEKRQYKLYACKKPKKIEGIIEEIKTLIDSNALLTIVNDTIKKINVDNDIEYLTSIKLAEFNIESIQKLLSGKNASLKLSFNFLSLNGLKEKQTFDYTYRELEKLSSNDIKNLFNNVKDDILNEVFIHRNISTLTYMQAFESFKFFYKNLSKEKLCFINIWYDNDGGVNDKIEFKNILNLILESDTDMQILDKNQPAPSRKNFFYTQIEAVDLFSVFTSSANSNILVKQAPVAKLYDHGEWFYINSKNIEKDLINIPTNLDAVCTLFYEDDIQNIKFDTNYQPLYFNVDEYNETRVNNLLENIVLHHIYLNMSDKTPVAAEIIDSDFKNRFPELLMLKDAGYVKRDGANITNRLEEFIQEVSFRSKELLSDKYPDIVSFNKQSLRPKKIYFLLVNIQDVDTSNLSKKLLDNFFENAARCGIYIILFGNNEEIKTDRLTFKFQRDEMLFYIDKHKATKKIEGIKFETFQDSSELIQSILNKSKENKQKSSLSINIGQNDTTSQPVYFEMGNSNEAYHAIIVGATGTGKTALINRIITDIAKQYDADQIRLILMDMKPQGVEFGIFKNHPNVEKIYLEPQNLEIAVDVLKELQKEIKKRGSLFRELSNKHNKRVVNIDQYNQISKTTLPRKILIIDEVQRLFKDNFSLNTEFNDRLEDIAKIGRAFGIHFILITQSLNGVRIKDSIKSQVKLRISFRVADFMDTMEIFDMDNKIATKLDKYQCVINDGFGRFDNNTIVNTYRPYEDEKMESIFLEEWQKRKNKSVQAEIIEQKNEKESDIQNKEQQKEDLDLEKSRQRLKELKDSLFED